MKIQLKNDRRWRLRICREILRNKRQFPLVLSTMNDDTAFEYLKAYYPTEFQQILGE